MATLARYTFAGGVFTPSLVDGAVTASALKPNGTADKITVADLGTYPSNPVLYVFPSGGPAFGHRQLIDSFEITVAPRNGAVVDLTSVSFKAARGGWSEDRGFEVTTSADGHTTARLSVQSVATARSTFTSYTVNLSDLPVLAGPLTIRWYYVTKGSSLALDFDDFTVEGVVAPVPSTESSPYSNVVSLTTRALAAGTESAYSNVVSLTTAAEGVEGVTPYSNVASLRTAGPVLFRDGLPLFLMLRTSDSTFPLVPPFPVPSRIAVSSPATASVTTTTWTGTTTVTPPGAVATVSVATRPVDASTPEVTETISVSAFVYGGSWTSSADGEERYTSQAGRTASLTVDVPAGGARVTLFGHTPGGNRGLATVSLNGASAENVSQYAAIDPYGVHQPFWTSPLLNAGLNVVQVNVLGQRDPAGSTGTFISLTGAEMVRPAVLGAYTQHPPVTGSGTLTVTAAGLTPDTDYEVALRATVAGELITVESTFLTEPDPTVLPPITITPNPPTMLAPNQVNQQVTFTTEDGLVLLRTTSHRLAGTTTWQPAAPVSAERSGFHTATFGASNNGGPLQAGTAYEGLLQLEALGRTPFSLIIPFTTAVATTTDEPIAPPATLTVTPTQGGGNADWSSATASNFGRYEYQMGTGSTSAILWGDVQVADSSAVTITGQPVELRHIRVRVVTSKGLAGAWSSVVSWTPRAVVVNPPGTVKYERWMYPSWIRNMVETGVVPADTQKVTWLPEGSRRQPEPGTTAVYGNSGISALRGKVWAICPEVFVNPRGEFLPQFQGIIQGNLVKYTGWMAKGSLGVPLGNVLIKRDGTKQPMRLGGGDGRTAAEGGTEHNFSTTQPKGLIANAKYMDFGGGIQGGVRILEGCGILDADDGFQYIMEDLGFDHGSGDYNDTLIINHCRFANHNTTQGLSWVSSGGSVHYQGDFFQPINGPTKFYILDTVVVTSYQGQFLQMGGDHNFQYSRRVHIKGQRDRASNPFIPGGQSSLIYDTSRAWTGVTRDFGSGENGTFLDTVPGKNMSRIIYGTGVAEYQDDWKQYQIAAPPRDFNPYSNMVPWSAADPRWRTSYPKVG